MFEATLRNRSQPELGTLTVTFPISEADYEKTICELKKLQIGDAVAKDCFIEDIAASRCPTLYRLIESSVNVDELDWLGKRLESFNQYGLLQYQAAADAWELQSMADLIDLTFYAPRTTVISDLSELDQIGRQHYRTVYGAGEAAALEEQEGVEVILNLFEDETGRITRFGVFYDNDLAFQAVYDRNHLPGTVFTHDCMMEVEIRPADQPSAAEPALTMLNHARNTLLTALEDACGSCDSLCEESAYPDENAEAILQAVPAGLLQKLRERGLCMRQLARHLKTGNTVYNDWRD